MTYILGADVSTRKTGCVGVPGGFISPSGPRWRDVAMHLIAAPEIRTRAPEGERVSRLVSIEAAFVVLLNALRPTHVAFEQYAPGSSKFAHSRGTAEVTGALKVAAAKSGAEVDSEFIATVRRALLDRPLKRGEDQKKAVQEYLLAHGAPEAFAESTDLCDAMAVADHRLGLLGLPRLGRGSLFSERKPAKKKTKRKVRK